MLDYAIAKEELRRLTKGVIPIALISDEPECGACCLAGRSGTRKQNHYTLLCGTV